MRHYPGYRAEHLRELTLYQLDMMLKGLAGEGGKGSGGGDRGQSFSSLAEAEAYRKERMKGREDGKSL